MTDLCNAIRELGSYVVEIRAHVDDSIAKRVANATKDITELQAIKNRLSDLISNFMVCTCNVVI
jgi:hypothetical protein